MAGGSVTEAGAAVVRAFRRARAAQRWRGRRRTPLGQTLTAAVCVLAGLMVVLSALNARGTDLRPGRNTDLVSLVQAQSRRNADLTRTVTDLREQVDALGQAGTGGTGLDDQLAASAATAGYSAVTGPAVTVTLDDAPASFAGDGIDPDLLLVHQQDIQAVVNALWIGGAEAMTIQGQRVVSTTGVKCVGNTVVLHGIPYAPPYVISAIGDPARLQAALTGSGPIQIYKQYVEAYRLVYSEQTDARVEFPAHEGALDLSYARPVGEPATGSPTPR